MKRWFAKWRKGSPARPEPAAAAYVDSEETIVINMSEEERFAPDEVRVQLDAAPAAPQSKPASPAASAPSDSDHTQVWTASDAASDRDETLPTDAYANSSAAIDVGVTAGLLILTEGPQRGRVFAVNLGRNRIGRGADNDIVLDTGDPAISKDDHLVIAADPKNQRFFLVPGNSTNLAYLDDQPLLETCEIADKTVIQIGETKLVFIQLFGNYLDWS